MKSYSSRVRVFTYLVLQRFSSMMARTIMTGATTSIASRPNESMAVVILLVLTFNLHMMYRQSFSLGVFHGLVGTAVLVTRPECYNLGGTVNHVAIAGHVGCVEVL